MNVRIPFEFILSLIDLSSFRRGLSIGEHGNLCRHGENVGFDDTGNISLFSSVEIIPL
jgi:hypothetical protein